MPRRYVQKAKVVIPANPFTDALKDPDGQIGKWLEDIHIEPVSAKEWAIPPRFTEGPYFVPDCQLIYSKQGRGASVTGEDKTTYPFKAGDMLLYPPYLTQASMSPVSTRNRTIVVHFYAKIFGQQDLIETLAFPRYIPGRRSARLALLFERLTQEYAFKPPGWRQMMAADILAVLMDIIRHHGARFGVPKIRHSKRHLRRLQPVFNLIQSVYGKPDLTVADMAHTLSISEIQLRRLFRQTTGSSPLRFLLKYRMEQACILLRTTDQPIKRIAETTGFVELPYFYRMFRQWVNRTPNQYRVWGL